MHFGISKTTERTRAPHITYGPQLGCHRQCGLAICTFHLGFSLVMFHKASPLPLACHNFIGELLRLHYTYGAGFGEYRGGAGSFGGCRGRPAHFAGRPGSGRIRHKTSRETPARPGLRPGPGWIQTHTGGDSPCWQTPCGAPGLTVSAPAWA